MNGSHNGPATALKRRRVVAVATVQDAMEEPWAKTILEYCTSILCGVVVAEADRGGSAW